MGGQKTNGLDSVVRSLAGSTLGSLADGDVKDLETALQDFVGMVKRKSKGDKIARPFDSMRGLELKLVHEAFAFIESLIFDSGALPKAWGIEVINQRDGPHVRISIRPDDDDNTKGKLVNILERKRPHYLRHIKVRHSHRVRPSGFNKTRDTSSMTGGGIPQLKIGGAIKVGDESGSIGLFFGSNNGKYYLATDAHVIRKGQNAIIRNGNEYVQIAECIWSLKTREIDLALCEIVRDIELPNPINGISGVFVRDFGPERGKILKGLVNRIYHEEEIGKALKFEDRVYLCGHENKTIGRFVSYPASFQDEEKKEDWDGQILSEIFTSGGDSGGLLFTEGNPNEFTALGLLRGGEEVGRELKNIRNVGSIVFEDETEMYFTPLFHLSEQGKQDTYGTKLPKLTLNGQPLPLLFTPSPPPSPSFSFKPPSSSSYLLGDDEDPFDS